VRAEQPVDHAGTPRRIGLIGAESSGKSTLAQALAAILPACVVPEVLREFTSDHGRPPRIHEQRAVLESQMEREDDLRS
jgi:nicotinamide riboside kinase